MRFATAMFALIALTLVGGCENEDGRLRPAARKTLELSDLGGDTDAGGGAGSAVAAVPAGKGVIKGKVKYGGPKPAVKVTERTCNDGKTVMVPDESLLVSDAGEIKNVIVFLTNPPGEGVPVPLAAVDQKDCMYLPHAVSAKTGQTLKFTSSDSAAHNINIQAKSNGNQNWVVQKGDVKSYAIKAPEFFSVKCDYHPWMTGFVGVFDHAFHAVTPADGTFEIKGLPPGNYTISANHEKLGLLSKDIEVTVTEDKPVEVTITYAK